MSGTSCDGIDVSCLKISKNEITSLWSSSLPIPENFKKSVLTLQKPNTKISLDYLLELNQNLGLYYAKKISTLIKTKPTRNHPDAIGIHGLTVFHKDNKSLQLVDPFLIALFSKKTTLSFFRQGDIAGGGEGAPLVPKYHLKLSQKYKDHGIALHNLGGISNFTYILNKKIKYAFDTGPGNIWIDEATRIYSKNKKDFDSSGLLAKKGVPNLLAVKKILAHSYFKKMPPKSTGRDDFPFSILSKFTYQSKLDLISTATEITAESIAQQYKKTILSKGFPLTRIVFCGGGSKNHYLLSLIKKKLGNKIKITTTDEIEINSQFIESQAFAYLSYLSLKGVSLGGEFTGSKPHSPPAAIIPGLNWKNLLKKIQSTF